MKKKILCLALCVVMVFASLVGCEEESREKIMNDIGRDASKGAITVTMHLLSEKPVSAEQEALVEAAVNEYMDDYNIYLDLKYFTEAPIYENGVLVKNGYYEALEYSLDMMIKKAAEDKANKKNPNKATESETVDATAETTGDVTDETTGDATGETTEATATTAATDATVEEGTLAIETDEFGNEKYLYIDENGLPKVYYPPNPDYHVDIFYFSGYDRYLKYKEAGYLNNFTNTMNSKTSQAVKHGVSSVYYDAVKKLNSNYDMMPCNTQVGEYTYLLLNKEVLESANYTVEMVGKLESADLVSFMNFVKENYTEYAPFYSNQQTLPAAFNGFTSATDKNAKFAVGYVKGDIAIQDEYAALGYEVVVLEKPVLETADVYENVFAISSYTNQIAKTYLVMYELYTNENIINLLAHGVEGTNYVWTNSTERDPDNGYEFYKVVEPITDDPKHVYVMDASKIGNSARVYPTIADNPRRVQNILNQNSEATFVKN